MATLYEQFRASFDVREGADYAIIENACGNERDQLEDDLIAHLDFFEIHALGMLQSAKAVPALKNKLSASDGTIKAWIAKAVPALKNLRLANDTRIAKALVGSYCQMLGLRVVGSGGGFFGRIVF